MLIIEPLEEVTPEIIAKFKEIEPMTKIIHIFTRHCICTDPDTDMQRKKRPETKEELRRREKNEEIIAQLKLKKGTGLNNSLKPTAGTQDKRS